jgi:uncharacterized protein
VLDDIVVVDCVAHAFDMSPANWADRRFAEPANAQVAGLLNTAPPGYRLDYESTLVDWGVDETANIMFKESQNDVAVFHSTPIFFFKDGWSSWEKSVEAVRRYPNRFIGGYCSVDPLAPNALYELDRQVEMLQPFGLKLYPISYTEGGVNPWRMDDPKVAFPLYERARELGIRHIAVHKAVPLGPTPGGAAFHPGDIEDACLAFPDMTFEIVHGGMAFNEETAWLLGRFDNVWVNLETLNVVLTLRPKSFETMLAGMMSVGGEAVIDRLIWGSGAINCHPRPSLEAFRDFTFDEAVIERLGLFTPVPQLTHEHKRKILGGNAARLYGLDLDAITAAIADDEFSQVTRNGLAEPYSTTSFAQHKLADQGVAL